MCPNQEGLQVYSLQWRVVQHSFVFHRFSGEATKEEIIETLKKKLPKYMIPNIFMQMERLPLTKNGKIDRKAIREAYDNK